MTTACFVYRLYAEDGALLYVGRTTNLSIRLGVHRHSGIAEGATWIEADCYETIHEAETAEARQIIGLAPRRNRHIVRARAATTTDPLPVRSFERRPFGASWSIVAAWIALRDAPPFPRLCQGCGWVFPAWSVRAHSCDACNGRKA